MRPLVMQPAIDLVGQQDEAISARDLGDRFKLFNAVGDACGVRGIVQDHDPGPAGVVATEHVELLRTQAPSILCLRWQPPHLPPNDLRLGCVGHPCRRGDDDIPVVDELHQEHELLGSWPDEHVVWRRRDPERTAVMLRHRLAELMQSLDRKVGLLKRVASQFLDHGRGNWKGRLSQPILKMRRPSLRSWSESSLMATVAEGGRPRILRLSWTSGLSGPVPGSARGLRGAITANHGRKVRRDAVRCQTGWRSGNQPDARPRDTRPMASGSLTPELTCVATSGLFCPARAALLLSHLGPPNSFVAPCPHRPARCQPLSTQVSSGVKLYSPSARAITTRWISDVPSPMRKMR